MTPHRCPSPNPWPHGSVRASEEVRSTAWKTDCLRKAILHRPVTNMHINVPLGRKGGACYWELEERESVIWWQDRSGIVSYIMW